MGPLTYERTGASPSKPGVVSSDPAILRESPLYREPAYMPEDYALNSMDTFDGDSETIIRLVYTGNAHTVEIYRVLMMELPYDINAPAEDGDIVLETREISGYPGVLMYPPSDSPSRRADFTDVIVIAGDIRTTVRGIDLDLETAVHIAESLQ